MHILGFVTWKHPVGTLYFLWAIPTSVSSSMKSSGSPMLVIHLSNVAMALRTWCRNSPLFLISLSPCPRKSENSSITSGLLSNILKYIIDADVSLIKMQIYGPIGTEQACKTYFQSTEAWVMCNYWLFRVFVLPIFIDKTPIYQLQCDRTVILGTLPSVSDYNTNIKKSMFLG